MIEDNKVRALVIGMVAIVAILGILLVGVVASSTIESPARKELPEMECVMIAKTRMSGGEKMTVWECTGAGLHCIAVEGYHVGGWDCEGM